MLTHGLAANVATLPLPAGYPLQGAVTAQHASAAPHPAASHRANEKVEAVRQVPAKGVAGKPRRSRSGVEEGRRSFRLLFSHRRVRGYGGGYRCG